jgi:hypothetical protein
MVIGDWGLVNGDWGDFISDLLPVNKSRLFRSRKSEVKLLLNS